MPERSEPAVGRVRRRGVFIAGTAAIFLALLLALGPDGPWAGPVAGSDFLALLLAMTGVFAVSLAPGMLDRRMERGDLVTLVVLPVITFPVAVLPGVVRNGFDGAAATYLLGLGVVITVAAVNYRRQPPAPAVAAEPESIETEA